ncbi:Ubiquinol-cytochrome C chaperone [Tsuneonella dongtanensis]|uniref:Ubiquinol-cytochrome C chaperone n=1 Tax=Tsuneonella dongtanensis TaxID=692370 RepID=A0A1B2AGZ3_9SPHN|nr:ubiquinol-cytochrome C chaperone family protein [Tsuneonella dongtanensis]ANY21414.1 Ubiquinol-cytochrome C chaperone [Tsuneonella dongtanensis]
MSILTRLFSSAPDPREALRPLWQAIVAEARQPAWYADAGVADTVNGRFEMVSAVFALVVLRMETGEGLAKETALLTELYVEDMEAQLREFGVGDVVVGKRMTKLMGATGGRIEAYRGGIANGLPTMTEAAARNMPLVDGASAEQVAERLLALWSRLQAIADAALLAGEVAR